MKYYDPKEHKKECGVFVRLTNGNIYLFEPKESQWRFQMIMGVPMLEVAEKGEIAFHAPISSIACVGGPQYIFPNADWKR